MSGRIIEALGRIARSRGISGLGEEVVTLAADIAGGILGPDAIAARTRALAEKLGVRAQELRDLLSGGASAVRSAGRLEDVLAKSGPSGGRLYTMISDEGVRGRMVIVAVAADGEGAFSLGSGSARVVFSSARGHGGPLVSGATIYVREGPSQVTDALTRVMRSGFDNVVIGLPEEQEGVQQMVRAAREFLESRPSARLGVVFVTTRQDQFVALARLFSSEGRPLVRSQAIGTGRFAEVLGSD